MRKKNKSMMLNSVTYDYQLHNMLLHAQLVKISGIMLHGCTLNSTAVQYCSTVLVHQSQPTLHTVCTKKPHAHTQDATRLS